MWDRQAKPESIYHTPLCPLTTDISVERDMTTGELLGYHEVWCTYTHAHTHTCKPLMYMYTHVLVSIVVRCLSIAWFLILGGD